MKFVILAATIGYVLGEDCGDVANDGVVVACADTSANYCNLAATASTNNDDNTGLCETKITAGNACVADGDCASGDCDASTCRLADGETCTASGECLDASYCKDTDGAGTLQCAADEADGVTCTVGGDCTSGACEGPCGASLTCGANTNADGALDGCCSDSVAVTDSANYCADGTVTVKVADDGVCSVAGNGAECASGTCTATADDSDDADVGACAATVTDATTTTVAPAEAGATGGACRTVVVGIEAVACGDALTCTTADATDGATGFCQDATPAPDAADDAAAAGALGGACNAAVTAVAACDGTDVCTDSVCTAAPETTAATDGDSPAAVFYGASMVAGAIAYLL